MTRNRSSLEAKKLEKLGAEIVEVPAGLGHKQDFVNAFKDSEGAFLMTPPIAPPDTSEFPLGCEMVDAAVEAGVKHIVFSTLANVEKITGGKNGHLILQIRRILLTIFVVNQLPTRLSCKLCFTPIYLNIMYHK